MTPGLRPLELREETREKEIKVWDLKPWHEGEHQGSEEQ